MLTPWSLSIHFISCYHYFIYIYIYILGMILLCLPKLSSGLVFASLSRVIIFWGLKLIDQLLVFFYHNTNAYKFSLTIKKWLMSRHEVATPFSTNFFLATHDIALIDDIKTYKTLVKFQHLHFIKPNIGVAINKLSQFMSCPIFHQRQALKCLLS